MSEYQEWLNDKMNKVRGNRYIFNKDWNANIWREMFFNNMFREQGIKLHHATIANLANSMRRKEMEAERRKLEKKDE